MYWHGIAAVAAAAAAAFRGGRVLPASWRQRFPDARLKIHLRFHVVRILWALLGIFHGRLWRFATQIIEVLVLFRATMNRSPQSTICQNSYKTFRNIQWWYLHWKMILNLFSQLFINDNRQHFVHDCTQKKKLPLFLLHRAPGCTCTVWCGGCPSMQQSGLSLSFVYVPSLWPPFIPFPLSPLHLESTLLRLKDLLFIVLGFRRHASLRDRSPESSEPHATLDSRSSLIRTTFGVHTAFFPGSHLRVSCTDQILRFTEDSFVSQLRCAARRDNMCLLSPSKGIKWWAFLRIFSSERILAQSCNRIQNSVLSLQYQFNWICFCLRCFGFSPILHPHRISLLGGVSFNNIHLVKQGMILLWARKLNSRFNMVTMNEVSLSRPKLFPSYWVIFWFFRSKLFPIAVRISLEILSLYGGFPSQSGFLEFIVSPW